MVPLFEEIHIENTNSCRYKCTMCPREQLTRPLGFMSVDDFALAFSRIGPFEGIVHLHGFGEPLLDRTLPEKIRTLKERCPKARSLVFSTLGLRLKEEFFEELLEAGLDNLVISFYGFSQDGYLAMHGFDGLTLAKSNLERLSTALKSTKSPCEVYIKVPGDTISSSLPIAPSPEKQAFCLFAQQLGFEIREWSYVHNYGSGRRYNQPKAQALCPVIAGKRKNILNITWNLDVIPCSYDFNATINFGNLKNSSLEEIFSSERYFSFLLAHATSDLSCHPVCQNCEKTDYE